MGFIGIVPNNACTSMGAVICWSPAYGGNGFRLVTADFGRDTSDRQKMTAQIPLEGNESFDNLSARRCPVAGSTHGLEQRLQSVREAIASLSNKKADESWL